MIADKHVSQPNAIFIVEEAKNHNRPTDLIHKTHFCRIIFSSNKAGTAKSLPNTRKK